MGGRFRRQSSRQLSRLRSRERRKAGDILQVVGYLIDGDVGQTAEFSCRHIALEVVNLEFSRRFREGTEV
jgi:hypothetical protein